MQRIILFGLLVAHTAHAQVATARINRPPAERVRDGGGAFLCQAIGGFGGLAGGAMLSLAIAGDRDLDAAVHLSALGGLLGAAGGLFVFDAVSDGDGSVATGLLGQAAGAALYLYGAYSDQDAMTYTGLGTILIGGALGYALEDAVDARPLVSAVPDGRGGARYALGITGSF